MMSAVAFIIIVKVALIRPGKRNFVLELLLTSGNTRIKEVMVDEIKGSSQSSSLAKSGGSKSSTKSISAKNTQSSLSSLSTSLPARVSISEEAAKQQASTGTAETEPG